MVEAHKLTRAITLQRLSNIPAPVLSAHCWPSAKRHTAVSPHTVASISIHSSRPEGVAEHRWPDSQHIAVGVWHTGPAFTLQHNPAHHKADTQYNTVQQHMCQAGDDFRLAIVRCERRKCLAESCNRHHVRSVTDGPASSACAVQQPVCAVRAKGQARAVHDASIRYQLLCVTANEETTCHHMGLSAPQYASVQWATSSICPQPSSTPQMP
jgi:hypothetical protein